MKQLLCFLFAFTVLLASAQKKIYTTQTYIKDASSLKYSPGDTIVIQNSVDAFAIYNLIGTREKPVVITTTPGVVIGGYSGYAFQLWECKFVKVTGLTIKGSMEGIAMKNGYVSDITFENISIDGGAIGLQVKTDPSPGNAKSYYPTTIDNIVVRNIRVKNTSAEGLYLGHTFNNPLYGQIPPPIIGLTVENVEVENTGWDGFQITNAQNCVVKNVTVKNAATRNQPSQRSGITLQDAVTGSFENLYVDGTPGSGLTIFGNGEFFVKNVTLKKCDGIFIDNRPDRGLNLPAKKLVMENINISGKGDYAVLTYNGTLDGAKAALPGTITNLVYDKSEFPKGISDPINKYLEKQPEPAPAPVPTPQPAPQPQPDPVIPAKKILVTIRIYEDGSTEVIK